MRSEETAEGVDVERARLKSTSLEPASLEPASLDKFSDREFRAVVLRALRLLLVLSLAVLPLVWWRMGGWRSGAMLVVGAAISGSGLWEWLRLLTALMPRLEGGGKASPMALLLVGFFMRLAIVLAVLYGSLRFLEGSRVALAVGLGLGIFALTIEAVRLARVWTA